MHPLRARHAPRVDRVEAARRRQRAHQHRGGRVGRVRPLYGPLLSVSGCLGANQRRDNKPDRPEPLAAWREVGRPTAERPRSAGVGDDDQGRLAHAGAEVQKEETKKMVIW